MRSRKECLVRHRIPRGHLTSKSCGNAVHAKPCKAVVLLAVFIAILPTNASAQAAAGACAVGPTAAAPGVVWQGTEPLALREIAGLLAPMLWFSGDEPLLAEGQPPIPTAHPCDAGDRRRCRLLSDHRTHISMATRPSAGPKKTSRHLRTRSSPSFSSTTSTTRRIPESAGTHTISKPPSSRSGSKEMPLPPRAARVGRSACPWQPLVLEHPENPAGYSIPAHALRGRRQARDGAGPQRRRQLSCAATMSLSASTTHGVCATR